MVFYGLAYRISGKKGFTTIMFADSAQRHLLDKADIGLLIPGKVYQVENFVVIAPLEQYGVELNRQKASAARCTDTRDHLIKIPRSG